MFGNTAIILDLCDSRILLDEQYIRQECYFHSHHCFVGVIGLLDLPSEAGNTRSHSSSYHVSSRFEGAMGN